MENYKYWDENVPLMIHAPHGGTKITDLAMESLVIGEQEIKSELLYMTDSYTNTMALEIRDLIFRLERKNKVGIFQNNLSRLVVDPERFPDEREEMNAVGMGAVYTHGSHSQRIRKTDNDVEETLLEAYFFPYAKAIEEKVSELLSTYKSATIVDLHSYASKALPYEMHQDDERPEICIGMDAYHTKQSQVDNVSKALSSYGYQVKVNSPFSGTYVPLKHYGRDKNVSSIMFEIRRDLYMDESDGLVDYEKYDELVIALADAIDAIID